MPLPAPVTSATALASAPRCTAPVARGRAGDGRVARAVDLLGGQRAVRRAEPQRVGQRLRALPDLLAGVDVEQPHRLEQLAGALAQRRLDARPRARRRRRPARRPPWPAGTSRPAAPATTGRWRRRAASRSSSIAQVRAGRPERGDDLGCSSPAWPTTVAVDDASSRAPAGVPRRVLVGAHARASTPRPPRPTPRAASTASAQSAGAARAPPAGRLARRRRARRRRAAAGAAGAASAASDLLVGRPPVDAERRRGATGSGRPGTTRPDLEQREVALARGRRCAAAPPSRPGSSVVRSSGSSSESGLASRDASRRGSSAGRPSASSRRSPTNG